MPKISVLPTINIIGAGKLGKTIAKLIAKNHFGIIKGICNSSLASSKHAINFIGAGIAFEHINDLPATDITFITVPDDKIKAICDELANAKYLNSASCVVHCSGLLTAEVLDAVRLRGCGVASIHPMHSFAEPTISVDQFAGTVCTIEGDLNAVKLVGDLFKKIGGKLISIDKNKKTVYHIAGVMAANYLITLADNAIKCLEAAGITYDEAMAITLNLMSGTLKNLSITQSTKKSLTGPIKRGDVATIKKHMMALSNKDIKKLYTVLGKLTLEITDLDTDKKQLIQNVLSEKLIVE